MPLAGLSAPRPGRASYLSPDTPPPAFADAAFADLGGDGIRAEGGAWLKGHGYGLGPSIAAGRNADAISPLILTSYRGLGDAPERQHERHGLSFAARG